MSKLSVRYRYMPRYEIPPRSRQICPPPEHVMVLTANATPKMVAIIENTANKLTNRTPAVNDLFMDHSNATCVERVVHALEHIVIANFLLNKTLDADSLRGQTVAVILPGNEHDGTDNTSVWIRDGLMSPHLFFASILQQIISFDGRYFPF